MDVNNIAALYKETQKSICSVLEKADGKGKFITDYWEKEIGSGITCVMQNGSIIEKAGVNFSYVSGNFSDKMAQLLGEKASGFSATGISSIIHSSNPFVPTIHMNVRYFCLDNGSAWFGGGIDLTPSYINVEEARIFHSTLKYICDKYNKSYYPDWKTQADDYFYLKHRNETRGIGGIFFDYIKPHNEVETSKMVELCCELANTYPKIYSNLMAANGSKTYSKNNKDWQKIRRGRYVEFNLLYDKGTKFGLESDGNTESILISLPSEVKWNYNHLPKKDSPEEATLNLLKKDINWVG